MELLIDWLKEKGTLISIEGNKPLLMTDKERVYFVIEGQIDVFAVRIRNDEAIGARKFLFEVYKGQVIFPILPREEETYGLLLSGKIGTTLVAVDQKDFILYREMERGFYSLINILDQWVLSLTKAMTTEIPPRIFTSIQQGKEVSAKVGENLLTKERVLWINIKKGKAKVNDHQEIHEGMYFPLTESTWMRIVENSEVLAYSTKELLQKQLLFSELDVFHRYALDGINTVLNQKKQQQKQQFVDKLQHDQWFVQKSILQLALVTGDYDASHLGEKARDDALLTVCHMVAKAIAIEINSSISSEKIKMSKDPLREIADASNIRMRQVVLKGKWFNNDNGPLVAFMEEDHRPVALIPKGPQQYQLYDPLNNTMKLVKDEVAEELEAFAYSFYRPFPNKILKLKDILKFGLESTWKRDIIMVLLMGIAGGLLSMMVPVATGIVFNNVIPEGERGQLLQVGFLLVAMGLAEFLFQLTRSFSMLRMEGKMDGSIQSAVWDRLLSLPAPFFKDYSSGELAMRAMGISEIRKVLSGVTITSILSSIFSVFNFVLLFHYHKKLALIASIPVTLSIVITLGLGYYQISFERRLIHMTNKIQGLTLQILGGIAKFKVAGAENRAFHQWAKAFSQQRKIAFKAEIISNSLTTFNACFPIVTSMIVYYFIVTATHGSFQPGIFIAFNAALMTFIEAMTSLSEAFLTVNAIIPMYETTKPILETLPEYDETKENAGELTGEIEVNHVSFRYKENGPLILKDISLHIKEGEYVALVGSSGSGKSTLFRILLGFEKPEKGQIYYNAIDISKVNIRSIRKQLGVVLQNSQLMAGDIFTNIIGSNPNLTLEDAWAAARMAGLDKDIELMPMGMHTVISEGGSTLSGGQRQRLLIARAIVNRPRIIYFDEATSALDNKTQKIVSDSLDNLSATRIVIAHRLSTIMNCHRIIVLDQGRIVEEGTYKELMEKNGFFATLAKRQLA